MNIKKTERSSYPMHAPALYMAQPCGASNNGDANNSAPDATPEVTSSADLTTIHSALEESRRVT